MASSPPSPSSSSTASFEIVDSQIDHEEQEPISAEPFVTLNVRSPTTLPKTCDQDKTEDEEEVKTSKVVATKVKVSLTPRKKTYSILAKVLNAEVEPVTPPQADNNDPARRVSDMAGGSGGVKVTRATKMPVTGSGFTATWKDNRNSVINQDVGKEEFKTETELIDAGSPDPCPSRATLIEMVMQKQMKEASNAVLLRQLLEKTNNAGARASAVTKQGPVNLRIDTSDEILQTGSLLRGWTFDEDFVDKERVATSGTEVKETEKKNDASASANGGPVTKPEPVDLLVHTDDCIFKNLCCQYGYDPFAPLIVEETIIFSSGKGEADKETKLTVKTPITIAVSFIKFLAGAALDAVKSIDDDISLTTDTMLGVAIGMLSTFKTPTPTVTSTATEPATATGTSSSTPFKGIVKLTAFIILALAIGLVGAFLGLILVSGTLGMTYPLIWTGEGIAKSFLVWNSEVILQSLCIGFAALALVTTSVVIAVVVTDFFSPGHFGDYDHCVACHHHHHEF